MTTSPLRRIVRWLADHRVALLSGAVACIFLLGYMGLDRLYASTPDVPHTFLDRIYGIFQILRLAPGVSLNDPSWELEVTRWLAILLIGYSAFALVARVSSREIGLATLKLGRDHVIVGGVNDLGIFLAQRFASGGSRVVMLDTSPDETRVPPKDVIVLSGDAPDVLLKDAQLARARLLLCVDENDALNADLLGYAFEIAGTKKGRGIEAMVHIVDPVLCNLVRARLFRLGHKDVLRTEFFNIYYNAGRELVRRHPPFERRQAAVPPAVHVLVVGVGRMGESVVVHIAKEWRRLYGGSGTKVAMTLIDLEATKRRENLVFRYPSLLNHAEIHALDTDMQPSVLSDLPLDRGNGGSVPITIGYVCLADTVLGLSAALILHEKLKRQGIPIVVRTQSDKGFTTLLARMDADGDSSPLIPFPQFPSDADPGEFVVTTREQIAQAIHDEYLDLARQAGGSSRAPFAVPWKELPHDRREANRGQADDIIRKVEEVGCDIEQLTDWDEPPFAFTADEIERLAVQEHARWMRERASQGWRYAPERDDRQKHHPSMVPWEDLSDDEKEKDRNAVRSLPSVLYRVDLRIVRRDAALTVSI